MQVDDELAAFLEVGGSLIVATVDTDGRPDAARAFDLQVLPDRSRVRVQLAVEATTAIANVDAGRSVAVTVTEVFTARSVQVKGHGTPTTPPNAADTVHGDRYRAEFLANVAEVEQIPIELPRRLLPEQFVAFEMDIEEIYDQTPGPSAGAPLGGDA
ncbi:MAG TPA: hypothetical protein VFZ17_08625 [Acidimicrobiia bacterium]|nr:hypothetical protein [Acidimicrobiia bacterium]